MIETITAPSRLIRTEPGERLAKATRPLTALLRQLAAVIERLTDAQYTLKPVGVVESSVGGHVRHSLDHVRALLTAGETGSIDYDHRRRGTPVELARCCALAEIDELVAEIKALPADVMDMELSLWATMTSGGESVEVSTSFGRELAYTLSHTIHHNALIGAMIKTLGGWLPERFGYAPSTPKLLNRWSCAPSVSS
jgi:uncharacterized damage-inducible protein DinB